MAKSSSVSGKTADKKAGVTTLPRVKPENVGISSQRLQRISPAMQRYIDKGLVPGVAWLVARDGKVADIGAIGMRDCDAGAPMRTDTIFRIASMTKPIVSVALMMLFEEGHFLLSDPVSKWIPEFANPMVAESREPSEYRSGSAWKLVPAKRPITVRHILTHTAGFGRQPYALTVEEFAKVNAYQKENETIGDFVKRYAKVPLNYHPGEEWDYSRATCVVGHLVEVISGKTLDEFLRERIFKPLKMTDTHFFLPREKLNRFAAAYTPGKNGVIRCVERPTEESRYVKLPHTYFMGSGGLVSTLHDYFRFDQMLLNGGELDGARILGRKTIELMTQIHTGDLPIWLPGPWSGFGLGFGIVRDTSNVNTLTAGHPGPSPFSIGTFSWGGAFCTYPWVDPKEKLVAMVFTQVSPYTHLNIRQEYASLVYQAIVD